MTYIRLIEVEVHRALNGAHIVGMIHTDHDTKDDGYVEDGYVIAWQRDNHGGHRGEGENWGTHRAQVNNQGDTMLIHGHYDIPSKTEALADMLRRAGMSVPTNEAETEIERLRGEWRKADDGWITAKEEITELQQALTLSVCYSPDAIRDSFADADKDHPDAIWVRQASDEQLLEVSQSIIGSDPTWRDFHRNIELGIEWKRNKESK